MHWKIPSIPDKTPRKNPSYKVLIAFFIGIVTAIYAYGVTLPTEQKMRLFIITLPVTALLFLACFSFLYIRYQHSVITCNNWEKEKKITEMEWQHWCQSSITSLGYVNYTPDKDGAGVFLKDDESIPMFPDKPRQLFNKQKTDEDLFSKIDKNLEKQCPNYRVYLSNIYIFDNENRVDNNLLIYNQWHLKPTESSSYQTIFSAYDTKHEDTFLIITIQSEPKFSQFVSAQLFSTNNQLINPSHSRVSIERIMEIDMQDIDNEIIKFINYSGISRKHRFQTWVTEPKQDIIDSILINYSDKKIEFDKHRPIYSLALSYSVPHPNAFLSYLSLVSEIAKKSGTDQVLIHSNTNGSSYAVYIRRF
ncbi:TPA: hypothetical protein ACF2YT_001131 [Providencia alcalifaciens]|uniref:hypothetical protein n=1 Tax=Providencia sp. wls1950 TaxID=2675147 RepID=UPI0012B57648|nr:hypothetical protein [Providencia sp. wls1950]MTB45044.1 hypothetical protein [Providencia sp. wls1950]